MSFRKTRWYKIISYLVIFSFLLTGPSQASLSDVLKPPTTGDEPYAQFKITDPEKIIIAENIGRIKEIFKGEPDGKLIINIQDAHCNFEAQTNISRILDTLVKNGLQIVALEGSTGEIDPSIFTTFPDEEIRRQVATNFMRKGKINGAEFLAITSKNPPELYGVETKEYYLANLAAFINTLEGRGKAKAACISVENLLNKLKQHIYSKELRELDEKSASNKNGALELLDYCKYLRQAAESKKLSVGKFYNLGLLYQTVDIEKEVNFDKAQEERSRLITDLEKTLTAEEIEDLFSKSVNFKSGEIASPTYHIYLRRLAQAKAVDLGKYPNLNLYVNYLVIYEKIDSLGLFKEISALEDELKEKLMTNNDQRALDRLSKNIRLLENMLDISMSKEDVEYYQKNKATFRSQVFIDFIKEKSGKYRISPVYDLDFALVDKYLPDLESFYRIADTRDEAIIENTLKKMDDKSVRVAALITGGYHTEGIAERLRTRGISYIVISPRITKSDKDNPYLEILSSERVPDEIDFKAGTGQLAVSSAMQKDNDGTGTRPKKEFEKEVAKALADAANTGATGGTPGDFKSQILGALHLPADMEDQVSGEPTAVQVFAVPSVNDPGAKIPPGKPVIVVVMPNKSGILVTAANQISPINILKLADDTEGGTAVLRFAVDTDHKTAAEIAQKISTALKALPPPPQYLEGVDDFKRLHILKMGYEAGEEFWFTEEGAKISTKVPLKNIQANPEHIAKTVIRGATTVIERGAIVIGCEIDGAILREGSEAYRSVLETREKEFDTWGYNKTYVTKCGQTMLGRGCVAIETTLTNVLTADNPEGKRTVLTRCSFKNADIGTENMHTDVKGNLFHTEFDVKIEGTPRTPIEISEAWFGWGFRHAFHVSMGGVYVNGQLVGALEFDRNPECYLEGVFPNTIITVERDESGEPILEYERDSTGKLVPIPVLDESGRPVVNAVDSRPVYKCKLRTWEVPAVGFLGWHTIYASYDGKLNPDKFDMIADITGGASRVTKDAKGKPVKEGSGHTTYVTCAGGVVAALAQSAEVTPAPGMRILGLNKHPDDLMDLYQTSMSATHITPGSIAGLALPKRHRIDPDTGREHWSTSVGASTGLSPSDDVPAYPFLEMPLLIHAMFMEMAHYYNRKAAEATTDDERARWDVHRLDGIVNAVLRTKAAYAIGSERAIYNHLVTSDAFRFQNGNFPNWGWNAKKGQVESRMFEDRFPSMTRVRTREKTCSMLAYELEGIPGYVPVFSDAEMRALSGEGLGLRREPVIAGKINKGKNVSISPYATIGKNVTLGDGVEVGPGVTLGDGVTIGAGTRLSFCSIGEGIKVGENNNLQYVILANQSTRRTSLGDNNTLTMVKALDYSMGNNNKAERSLFNMGQAGDRNIFEPWTQASETTYGCDNIVGNYDAATVVGDGTTSHHLATRRVHVDLSSEEFTVEVDGELTQMKDQNATNCSAGSIYIGTAQNPIRLITVFVGANSTCIVPKDAPAGTTTVLDHCFAKDNIRPGTQGEPYSVCRGSAGVNPGEIHDYRFGPLFVFRFFESKKDMNRTPLQKKYLGHVLESKLLDAININSEKLQNLNNGVYDRVSVPIERLVTDVSGDLRNMGECADINERIRLIDNALGQIQDVLQPMKKKRARYNREIVLLEGLRKNIAALIGAYRLRDGYLTECFMVKEGQVVQEGRRRPCLAFYPKKGVTAKIRAANLTGLDLYLEQYRYVTMGHPAPDSNPDLMRHIIAEAVQGVKLEHMMVADTNSPGGEKIHGLYDLYHDVALPQMRASMGVAAPVANNTAPQPDLAAAAGAV